MSIYLATWHSNWYFLERQIITILDLISWYIFSFWGLGKLMQWSLDRSHEVHVPGIKKSWLDIFGGLSQQNGCANAWVPIYNDNCWLRVLIYFWKLKRIDQPNFVLYFIFSLTTNQCNLNLTNNDKFELLMTFDCI